MNIQFHHIQITVNDVKKAEGFYDQLFALLGFDLQKKYSGYLEHADMEVVEYIGDSFDFGICSPRKEWKNEKIDSRKPGSVQHIAFKAESREVVDSIFPKIKALGVKILTIDQWSTKSASPLITMPYSLKAQKAFVLNYFIMPDSLN